MISYNQIHDNEAKFNGAGILAYYSTPNLINNTITQNRITLTSPVYDPRGGGISYYTSGSFTGVNNIIYDNYALSSPECYGPVNVTYSCCSQGLSGTGNITDDPMFFAPAEDDFSLTFGSPCINSGDPSSPLDPDGTRADMGAIYFHLSAGFEFLPYMPTDFTVAHHNELLEATLSWTNPAINMVGDPLTELWGVHIYRDGEFVVDITDVMIGQPSSYVDDAVPSAGMHEWEQKTDDLIRRIDRLRR